MGAAKVIGGLLALVAGILSLLVALDLLIGIGIFGASISIYIGAIILAGEFYIYLGLIFAIIAIIGGIVGMAGKKAGGGIALIIAVIWLIGGFLASSVPLLFPMSAMLLWTGQIAIGGVGIISIEAIICLVGGILVLAGGSD